MDVNMLRLGIDGPDFGYPRFQISGDLSLHIECSLRGANHFDGQIGNYVDGSPVEIDQLVFRSHHKSDIGNYATPLIQPKLIRPKDKPTGIADYMPIQKGNEPLGYLIVNRTRSTQLNYFTIKIFQAHFASLREPIEFFGTDRSGDRHNQSIVEFASGEAVKEYPHERFPTHLPALRSRLRRSPDTPENLRRQ